MRSQHIFLLAGIVIIVLILAWPRPVHTGVQLLNVSYDPTREFYKVYNKEFASYWLRKTGQVVTIRQSHGGSGKQARSVIDGLQADVVTLGIASDINAIQQHGLIANGWQQRLPHSSTPYTSTIVFLVRTGNPKHILDWSDLIRPGISVITPNPKTSSGGRWNYLAAWGQALRKSHGNQNAARAYTSALYANVPVLDTGARGASDTFAQRGIGDVLIGWESDAELFAKVLGKGKFQVIYPSVSILAEPAVSVVDSIVGAHHTATIASAYLQHLYSPAGQEIAAQCYYRPTLPAILKKYAGQFPRIPLFKAETLFGTWDQIHKVHFSDGGTFDQIVRR